MIFFLRFLFLGIFLSWLPVALAEENYTRISPQFDAQGHFVYSIPISSLPINPQSQYHHFTLLISSDETEISLHIRLYGSHPQLFIYLNHIPLWATEIQHLDPLAITPWLRFVPHLVHHSIQFISSHNVEVSLLTPLPSPNPSLKSQPSNSSLPSDPQFDKTVLKEFKNLLAMKSHLSLLQYAKSLLSLTYSYIHLRSCDASLKTRLLLASYKFFSLEEYAHIKDLETAFYTAYSPIVLWKKTIVYKEYIQKELFKKLHEALLNDVLIIRPIDEDKNTSLSPEVFIKPSSQKDFLNLLREIYSHKLLLQDAPSNTLVLWKKIFSIITRTTSQAQDSHFLNQICTVMIQIQKCSTLFSQQSHSNDYSWSEIIPLCCQPISWDTQPLPSLDPKPFPLSSLLKEIPLTVWQDLNLEDFFSFCNSISCCILPDPQQKTSTLSFSVSDYRLFVRIHPDTWNKIQSFPILITLLQYRVLLASAHLFELPQPLPYILLSYLVPKLPHSVTIPYIPVLKSFGWLPLKHIPFRYDASFIDSYHENAAQYLEQIMSYLFGVLSHDELLV